MYDKCVTTSFKILYILLNFQIFDVLIYLKNVYTRCFHIHINLTILKILKHVLLNILFSLLLLQQFKKWNLFLVKKAGETSIEEGH